MSSNICQHFPGVTINSCHLKQYESPEQDLSALKLLQLPSDIFSYVMNLVATGETSEKAAQNAIAMSQVCVLTHLYSHQGDPLKVINQLKLSNDALQKMWNRVSTNFQFSPPSLSTQIHTWLEKPLDTFQKIWSGSLAIQYEATIPRTLTEIKAWIEDSVNSDQLDTVIYLNLCKTQLQVIPSQITKFTRLWNVHLEDNQISIIPDFLESLDQLACLFLGCNQITALGSLGNIPKLETLGLNNNQIKAIPESFKNLTQLKWINLDDNQISIIPDFIEDLTCLKSLNLRNNRITTIPDSMGKVTRLNFIDLEGNPLFCIYEDRQMDFFGREGIESLIRTSSEFSDYKCLYSFSSFVQNLALGSKDPETVKSAFFRIPEQDRNLIYEMIELFKGQTNNSKWGEEHAFDDMNVFCHVVRKSIAVKFDLLSQEQENTVYGYICQLAGHPSIDLGWGKSNAFENVLRLCDAMQQLDI